jgi:pyruvate carboxylase
MENNQEYKKIYVNGEYYKTKVGRKYEDTQKWEGVDLRKVTAFIPGTVREIFVKRGQQVKEGDNLLILEAMKMKNKLKAPISGTIREVYCRTNQNVAKNVVLIEFE